MKIGEIYFIKERDRIAGKNSSYVKIGMVGDTERGSKERLSEHQTGNPRDLELHHVVETPSPFRVEKYLHQQFGSHRVRSEWFALDDETLEHAVQTCERLAAEAFAYLPVVEESVRLKDVLSVGDKIAPSPEATEWHRQLMTSKAQLKICGELKHAYIAVAAALSPEDRVEAETEDLILTEDYVVTSFNEEGFSKAYPALTAQFTEQNVDVSGRFTPAKLATVETDGELSAFQNEFLDACERVNSHRMTFGELFDLYRDLEMHEGAYQWDGEIAEAHLRALCGASPGIEGLCTWNRKEKVSEHLDREGLEASHPDKYREFLSVEMRTRVKTRKRSRRKK